MLSPHDGPGEEPMPLPSDPKTFYLGGLVAFLTALYVAAEIVWPLVLAFVLSLLLKPAQRLLERVHTPRLLSALLLVFAVLALVLGLETAVAVPAAAWAAKLPDGIVFLPRSRRHFSSTPGGNHAPLQQQASGG